MLDNDVVKKPRGPDHGEMVACEEIAGGLVGRHARPGEEPIVEGGVAERLVQERRVVGHVRIPGRVGAGDPHPVAR